MTRILAASLAGIALLSLAAACGTGSPAPAGSARPSTRDTERTWLQFASCLRQHGVDEPDPTFDSEGNPQWAVSVKGLPDSAQQACYPILQSLHLQPGQAADPQRIAALTRFAQCIRQHGVADFPDPDRTGSFPTNGDPTREPGWAAASQACRSLQPAGKS